MPLRYRLCVVAFGALVAAPSGGATAAEFQIVNSSGKSIHELYIVPRGQREWGPNRLQEKQPRLLGQGESHTIPDLAPGSYELRLVDADGRECEIEALKIEADVRLDLTAAKLNACTSSH